MKNILMVLALTAIAYTSAEAQAKKTTKCVVDEKQVFSAHGGNCYKTEFAQNFPVCKGKTGYYVCCKPTEPIHTVYNYDVPNSLYRYDDDGANHTDAAAEMVTVQEKSEKTICKKSPNTGVVSCYQTEHAQNYKVCKGDNGYFVCGW
ncbi:MAG: hypothetical protein K9G49_15410 [Taibaiella sp.]|nr:hypothetical protein [Taibaiella sp.]